MTSSAPFPIPQQPNAAVPEEPLNPNEILRRLEITRTDNNGIETKVGIGKLCDNTSLPVPWKTHSSQTFSKKDVFWFTELGWAEYGERIYRMVSLRPQMFIGPNAQIVLREISAGGQFLSYRDAYQVAIRATWRVWLYLHANGGPVVVAARSRTEAARLIGISPRTLATYGSITSNLNRIAQANAQPGVVMSALNPGV